MLHEPAAAALRVGAAATIHQVRIAMVASECEPFAKTGGLADVVDGLARALAELGHETDVYLPRYRGLEPPAGSVRQPIRIALPSGPGPDTLPTHTTVSLWDCPGDGYRLRLVDHPPSFDRAGLYGQDGTDYPDNGARFALLGRVALAAAATDVVPLDVMHGHDWQAGPALLAMAHGARSEPALEETVTVLTCHNLAYHGWVPPDRAWQLGLRASLAGTEGVDLLREGIGAADMVNTVSPTYAVESLSAEYGGGVDAALRARGDTYRGILNGLDSTLWDPATDEALAATYDSGDLSGKAADRLDLAARHGLSPDGPIFGMVGRLDPQKGFDLVAGAASGLLAMGGRLIVLGTGDARLLAELGAVARQSPDRVALLDRFDRDEARRIYAGADIFLMPSRFEPSGQGQLIAFRYGTVPLVRRTGGLADTIRDVDAPRAQGAIAGTGYVFDEATPEALLSAAQRAVNGWANRTVWTQLVRRGMAEDHSWARPARLYEQLYRDARELRSRSSGGTPAVDGSRVVPRS